MSELTMQQTAPFLKRVQRNHGLEHATVHLLTAHKHNKNKRFAGRADHHGFYLYGEFETAEVEKAARDALARMNDGEHQLAVHPNCGTNLVVSGILAGAVSLATMWGTGRDWRKNLERFPTLILMLTLTGMISPAVGMRVQRDITTTAEMGNLRIVDVTQSEYGNLTIHRIETVN